jgi:transcriptional regulator with PAS, ATPase and Fis domain
MVEAGTFRQDLYFRINAFPIHMPSLRDRKEDIIVLAESFLRRLSPDRNFQLTEEAKEFLTDYEFPGNIRELRNMLERAILLVDTDKIQRHHLIDDIDLTVSRPEGSKGTLFNGEVIPLHDLESRYLQWVISESNENKKTLATKLGLTSRTFYRKIKEIKGD